MRRAVTTMCLFIGGSAVGYVLVGLLAAAFGAAVAALVDRIARRRRGEAGVGVAQDMPAGADAGAAASGGAEGPRGADAAEDGRADGDGSA